MILVVILVMILVRDDDGQVKTAFTPSQALKKMLLMLAMFKIKIVYS